jgi:hypothetical protein
VCVCVCVCVHVHVGRGWREQRNFLPGDVIALHRGYVGNLVSLKSFRTRPSSCLEHLTCLWRCLPAVLSGGFRKMTGSVQRLLHCRLLLLASPGYSFPVTLCMLCTLRTEQESDDTCSLSSC